MNIFGTLATENCEGDLHICYQFCILMHPRHDMFVVDDVYCVEVLNIHLNWEGNDASLLII